MGTVSNVLNINSYLWHSWPSRHWPVSGEEESRVVTDLRERASRMKSRPYRRPTRDDVTLLMGMLRNGMEFTELEPLAPGSSPALLAAAYDVLEQLRRSSVEGFERLLDGHPEHMSELIGSAPEAAKLMPVPTYRLVEALREGESRFQTVVHETRSRVRALALETHLLEKRLAAANSHSNARWAIEVGRKLYDPYEGGVWSRAFFVPTRVGMLVPERIAGLLGSQVKGVGEEEL